MESLKRMDGLNRFLGNAESAPEKQEPSYPRLDDHVSLDMEDIARELAKVKKYVRSLKIEIDSLKALHTLVNASTRTESELKAGSVAKRYKSGVVIYKEGKTKRKHDGVYGVPVTGKLGDEMVVDDTACKARIKGTTVNPKNTKFKNVPPGTWCLVTNKTGAFKLVKEDQVIPMDAEPV